ncbi:MAG: DUF2842 domain-containing protein [Paracoccaceae bacterium]|nr:DUF2842 domain-containing protein [Paracoccaceae bacterium]MDE2694027.1 DUF2842 domain-containing protein [Paracoccaceae bacterium]
MFMSYRLRRILSVFVLLIALPIYVVIVISVMALFERPPLIIELLIYLALGVVWAFPLKSVFMGVGQEDPDKNLD